MLQRVISPFDSNEPKWINKLNERIESGYSWKRVPLFDKRAIRQSRSTNGGRIPDN